MHARGAAGGAEKAMSVSGRSSTVGMTAASHAPPSHTDPLPRVQTALVELEANDTTRTELVKVIIAWLVRQGFTSSAQVLREESTAQLRDEHNQRKSVRAICRAVDEQDWEGAQRHLRKLQSRVPTRPQGVFQTDDTTYLTGLARSLPFLLAQQQFLELVDEDDGQRAYAFFMRSIKPFESTISREHFQKLNYLLTCKTVAESAGMYPQLRGWTAEVGRAQLLQYISDVAGDCLAEPYCRQGNITGLGIDAWPDAATALLPLETMAAQSLAYQLLASESPQLTRGREAVTARSLLLPLSTQMAPSELLLRLDVTQVAKALLLTPATSPSHPPLRLTACQPFLSVPAVAVGTHEGHLLWIPLGLVGPNAFASLRSRAPLPPPQQQQQPSSSTALGDSAAVIFRHKYAVKGMRRHRSRLLLWGGPQVVLLDFAARMRVSGTAPSGQTSAGQPTALVGAGSGTGGGGSGSSRGESPLGAGDGGDRGEITHTLTHGADVLSSCFFPCGTMIAAGLSDGTVTVWDALKGAKMFENTFGSSPIVSLLTNHTGSTYYAATKEGTIYIVDVVAGMVINTLASPIAGELASITLSPSSMLLLAAYRGGALRLWDVLLGKQLQYHFLGAERSAPASYPVAFGCQDHHIIAGSSDGCVYTWTLTGAGGGASPPTTRGLADVFLAARPTASAPVGLPSGVREGVAGQVRGSLGCVVRPSSQLPLHRECVTDVNMESVYLVSCAGDGMVCICSNGAR